MIKKTCVLIFM